MPCLASAGKSTACPASGRGRRASCEATSPQRLACHTIQHAGCQHSRAVHVVADRLAADNSQATISMYTRAGLRVSHSTSASSTSALAAGIASARSGEQSLHSCRWWRDALCMLSTTPPPPSMLMCAAECRVAHVRTALSHRTDMMPRCQATRLSRRHGLATAGSRDGGGDVMWKMLGVSA
jgi:hypothetical protein